MWCVTIPVARVDDAAEQRAAQWSQTRILRRSPPMERNFKQQLS